MAMDSTYCQNRTKSGDCQTAWHYDPLATVPIIERHRRRVIRRSESKPTPITQKRTKEQLNPHVVTILQREYTYHPTELGKRLATPNRIGKVKRAMGLDEEPSCGADIQRCALSFQSKLHSRFQWFVCRYWCALEGKERDGMLSRNVKVFGLCMAC